LGCRHPVGTFGGTTSWTTSWTCRSLWTCGTGTTILARTTILATRCGLWRAGRQRGLGAPSSGAPTPRQRSTRPVWPSASGGLCRQKQGRRSARSRPFGGSADSNNEGAFAFDHGPGEQHGLQSKVRHHGLHGGRADLRWTPLGLFVSSSTANSSKTGCARLRAATQ
jgi:hypothetical protein